MNGHEMYTLRCKLGGEIHTALQALTSGTVSEDDLREMTGLSRTPWLLRQLPNWFDNIGVNKTGDLMTATYADIMPSQVGIVTSDVTFNASQPTITNHAEQTFDKVLKWPLAPPIIGEMSNFEKPSWFDKMEKMVSIGSNIALESPPGMGKDTAVQQLAAKHRKPLVTIPGDAGFRRRDLVGSPDISGGTSYFNVAEYAAAAVNGWWVLITEINSAEADALMYINSQLAAPYVVTIDGKAYPVHKDFRLFISYNAGLIGTKPLPQSFKDRFFSIKIPFFTKAALKARLSKMIDFTVNTNVLMAVAEVGHAIYEDHKAGRIRYQITARRLHDSLKWYVVEGSVTLEDALQEVLCDSVDVSIEQATISGTIKRISENLSMKAQSEGIANVMRSTFV